MGAAGVARDDVGLVLDRARLGQQPPVRDPLGRPGRRHQHDLGAGVEQGPEHLREAQVVAGGQAELPVHDRAVARSHQLGLALTETEQMHLPVRRQHRAVRTEQHRGVEEATGGIPLDERAHVHRRTELPGHCLERGDDRPVQRLRAVLPGVVGETAVRPQLGQHDEVGAGLCADQGGDPVECARTWTRCRRTRAG